MDKQLLVLNPLLEEMIWVKSGKDHFQRLDDDYWFGYNNFCDYKILRFRCAGNSRNRRPRVEVYEFASKTWKSIDNISFDWVLKVPLSILALRGTPYCIGLWKNCNEAFIQSFDFSKERFQPVEDRLPFEYDEFNPIALEIFRGDRLSVLVQCHKTKKICVWVKHWLMLPSWSRLLVVDIPDFPLLYPRLSVLSTKYFVDKYNRLVVTSIGTDGILINRVNGEKDFETARANAEEDHSPSLCDYVPSLVRLPGFLKQHTSQSRLRRNILY